MMACVLADFSTKDRTLRLVRPSFPFVGAAAGYARSLARSHARADVDEESGRPSFVLK